MQGKANKRRVLGTVTTIIGIVALIILSLFVLAWRKFGYVERYATCNDGITVWRRDPGAFASYRYKIKRGTTTLESELSTKEVHEFLKDYDCVIPGGG